MTNRHFALKVGAWSAGARLILGLLHMLVQRSSPETAMLALADLPTLGVYAILQPFGFDTSIRDATDIRFLLVGVVTWFLLGAIVTSFATRARSAGLL